MDNIYERALNARTVLGQAYEIVSKISNQYDKYTVLKSGYGQACVLIPDNLKLADRPKLHVTPADKYAERLNSLRSRNIDSPKFNKTLDRKYYQLQKNVIAFQKYALAHGVRFIDNLYLLNEKGESTTLTLQGLQDYIDPYYEYLQKLYRKFRKNNLT